ncbi:ABSCISIC ACID-INSENSITIVE 5-like protein 7 [Linum grandiflorum]
MGSNFNFSSFGNPSSMGDLTGNNTKLPANSPLVRQSSVYSLTFDELQNTWGGSIGKDFGSMNMDELLKNICTAEETSTISVVNQEANLQRQGSLTLPRTLSQKTVDEVWKDFVTRPPDDDPVLPQRQRTLGEMTLEEFLLKAGVVREDNNNNNNNNKNQFGRPSNVGFFGESVQLNGDHSGLALGFQPSNNSFLGKQDSNFGVNVAGIRPPLHQQPHQQQKPHQQQPVLFPKPANVGFAPPMHNKVNVGRSSAGGVSVTVAKASPASQKSPDVLSRSDADTSSVSPVPYVFSRGRRPNTALEKVVERRQRRMIKNRESAARSRARKQAYTLELEAEVAKLKELNEELERKQAEIMQMQQNQCLEKMKHQWGGKRLCLRRTLTGPW